MNYAAFFLNLVRLEQQAVRPVVQDLQTRLDVFGRSGNVVDVVNGLVSRRIGVDVLAKLYAETLAGFDHAIAGEIGRTIEAHMLQEVRQAALRLVLLH